MVRVVVTEVDGSVRELNAAVGLTVLDLARQFDLSLECTCGGLMACATCHVVVDAAWSELLPRPSAEEQDMLALAVRPQRRSRLGCQLRLTADLDGFAFRVVGE